MQIERKDENSVEFYHPRLDQKLTDKVNTDPADLTVNEVARFLSHAENYCSFLSACLCSLVPPEEAEFFEEGEITVPGILSKEGHELYTESFAHWEAAELLENCIVTLGADQPAIDKENQEYAKRLMRAQFPLEELVAYLFKGKYNA